MSPLTYRSLSRFDFVSIRLVVDCIQHGSLSAAALEAHLAVAAASRRLRDLEQAIGEPLFVRHGRGLHPTSAGRIFYRYGLIVLQSLEQMGGELTNLRLGVARHVRLSASSAAISQFLPPLLNRYAREHPRVHVQLEEQVSDGVVRALREGRADVGIFVEGPDTHGLECLPFRHDELVLVLPNRHRLARSRPIAFADTLDEDWITFTEGAALLQQQHQAAHAEGRLFRLRMQVRSFDAACHLVAAGLGIAMLPKAVAVPIARSMKLRCRALSDAWAVRKVLIGTRAGPQEPEVETLVRFLAPVSQNAKAGTKKRQ